jgi:hypothetical protein
MPRGGKTRTSGQGRPKGSKNKLTVEAKEAFRLAAEGAGGVEALTKFAEEHPKVFWPLYARLIPIDVTSGGKPVIPQSIRIDLVDPNAHSHT